MEGRILGFQGEEAIADFLGDAVVLRDLGGRDEPLQAELVEAVGLAVERALRRAGGPRALGGRLPEEDHRSDQLIRHLLRPPGE